MQKIIILIFLLLITNCNMFDSKEPTEFKTGDETFIPYGCLQMRTKNKEADC